MKAVGLRLAYPPVFLGHFAATAMGQYCSPSTFRFQM